MNRTIGNQKFNSYNIGYDLIDWTYYGWLEFDQLLTHFRQKIIPCRLNIMHISKYPICQNKTCLLWLVLSKLRGNVHFCYWIVGLSKAI